MSFYDDASLVFLPSSGAGKDGKAYSIKPVPEYGTNLVTNGGFNTDSDWTKVNATISGGTGNLNGTGVTSLIFQSGVLAQNITYRLTFSVSNYNSLGQLEVINNDGTPYYLATSNGNHTIKFTHSISNQNFLFRARNNAIAEIDNVSVREVIVGDGDFTFSRGSNLTATRVDSNGLIEKGRENLLLQSNQFDTTWSGNASVTSGQSGYDGSSDAWLLSITASGAYLYQDKAVSGVQTFSFYAKEGTLARVNVVINASVNVTANFDLANGIVLGGSQNITSSISSIGNGWYRCSVTYDKGTTNRFRLYPVELAGGGTSGNIYIQDAQLEQGLVATEYIESGASTGKAGILEQEPRFDYSNGASCPSLLLEPSRTQLVTQSEYFGGYSNSNSTDEPNATTSPEGLTNATSFLEAATTGQHKLTTSLSFDGSSTYTFSIFAKTNGRDLYIDTQNSNEWGGRAWFDLTNGTANSVLGTANIEDFGNGWYRCIVTGESTLAGGNLVELLTSDGSTNSTTGDITKGVFIYGAQMEQGSYSSSYIPNHSGGSVTRGADLGSLSTLPETLSTNYTIFGEITRLIPNDEVDDNIIELTGTASSRFRLLANQNSYTRFRFYPSDGSASVSLYESTGEWSQGSTIKWAFVYQIGSIEGFVNGESIGTTSADMEFTSLFLRTASKLKKILVFNEALSTTDCEILTGATSYESFSAMATALNYTTYE